MTKNISADNILKVCEYLKKTGYELSVFKNELFLSDKAEYNSLLKDYCNMNEKAKSYLIQAHKNKAELVNSLHEIPFVDYSLKEYSFNSFIEEIFESLSYLIFYKRIKKIKTRRHLLLFNSGVYNSLITFLHEKENE